MAAAKTCRVQILMSPGEVAALDDWRFAHRVSTRSEAIRRLAASGPRVAATAKKVADSYLRDEFAERAVCISDEHHADVRALFDAIRLAETGDRA